MPPKRNYNLVSKNHSKTRKHAKRLAKKANLFRVARDREDKFLRDKRNKNECK